MTYLSKYDIKPYDIFFANKTSEFENNYKHYYVCIYTQKSDESNSLSNDIYGLMITTNQKYKNIINDYNVEIEINGTTSFVCCDKLVRIKIDENVELKNYKLTQQNIEDVHKMLNKFISEIKRQTNIGGLS